MATFESGKFWVAGSIQGSRATQQDVFHYEKLGEYELFLLSDGNGDEGRECAKRACDLFPDIFKRRFLRGIERETVPQVFEELDKVLKRSFHGATTLLMALIGSKYQCYAHVGDTRALAECSGRVSFITGKPHLVRFETERLRVRGLKVRNNRLINGDESKGLAISRYLGGAQYGDAFSWEPEVATYSWRRGRHVPHYIILGTDDFWASLEESLTSVSVLSGWLRSYNRLTDCAEHITAEIKRRDPENTTFVIIDRDRLRRSRQECPMPTRRVTRRRAESFL